MNRRRVLYLGAAGVVAASAGVAWQMRRSAAGDDGGIWDLRFPQPDGSELVMAAHRGRPLLLNFWATWCVPCVKEMPALDRFQQRFSAQGWQVIGIAIDRPAPVLVFLQQVKVGFPIGVAGFEGAEVARRLGNAQGALPFSVVFDASGRPVHRKLGETNDAELASWARML